MANNNIDPALLAQYQQYFDPTAFNTPKGAGNQGSSGSTLGTLAFLSGDLGGSSLLDSLFGSKASFKPYIDANGNYVWANPNQRNPVPVANTPGASLKPSSTYTKMANQIQAITDLLPAYNKAVSGQIIPNAQASLAAQQATSPALAQLMTELYGTYGPQLNDIGNQINRTNAVYQTGTDAAALAEAQKSLIPNALATAKQYDPEYFATREAASKRLQDLLQSINLSSGLSPTEQREISQGLATEGARRGTGNAPSNLDTISNAMQYGQAGFNRLQTNRSALSSAISNATAALPSFKSGTDVFQVATGRSSTPNPGNAQFTGVNNVNNAAQQSLGLAGGLGSNYNTTLNNQMQINASKKDWADYLNQVTSSIGNLTSSAGSIAGIACWIARKVYGFNNPLWMKFREWLLNEAPEKFRNFYLCNGEVIANKLTYAQQIEIQSLMNTIISH